MIHGSYGKYRPYILLSSSVHGSVKYFLTERKNNYKETSEQKRCHIRNLTMKTIA